MYKRQRLTWEQTQALDRLVPAHFETPLGRRVPIDYDAETPGIEIRLQEMFGVTQHPVVGANRLPPVSYTHLDVYKRQVHVDGVGHSGFL